MRKLLWEHPPEAQDVQQSSQSARHQQAPSSPDTGIYDFIASLQSDQTPDSLRPLEPGGSTPANSWPCSPYPHNAPGRGRRTVTSPRPSASVDSGKKRKAPSGPASSCAEPFEDEGLHAFLKQLASGRAFLEDGGPSLGAGLPQSRPESAALSHLLPPPNQETRTAGTGPSRQPSQVWERCSNPHCPCCSLPLQQDGRLDPSVKLRMTVWRRAVLVLSIGEILAMPLQQLAGLWKVLRTSEPIAMARLGALVREASQWWSCLHISRPQMAHMLQVVKMEETPLVDAAPSAAMWAAIAASLDIDREQQAFLMQHRQRFYSTLGTLLHAHIAAAAQKSWAGPSRSQQTAGKLQEQLYSWGSSAGASQEALASTHISGSSRDHAALEASQLHHTLSAEVLSESHWLSFDLLHKCWIQVLDQEQCAKIMVQAYPWAPDILAILNVLAHSWNEPAYADLMISAWS
ncbi:hypothetical protein WJX74_002760 [Apatococcus lobatus]|uniref:Uncharacterized protein n=1 Tax=Apatococcus lobatus TaxID=904363 RepID=A0AAW1REW4_9CHLO